MSKGKSNLKRDRTAFEWAILVLSIVAIVAIVAGLLVSSLTYDSTPAKVTVGLEPIAGRSTRFLLIATNRGGTTAEDLKVEVRRGTGSVEVEFRAVPKGDEEEAIVEIGGRGTPTAIVRSYREP